MPLHMGHLLYPPSFNFEHHSQFFTTPKPKVEKGMAAEAPSWADQWGAGGIGAMEEETTAAKNEGKNKGESKASFAKVKAAASVGALKVKNGASTGVKWIKNKCNKKSSSPKS